MKPTVKTGYTVFCVIYVPFTQEVPENQEGFKLNGTLQGLVYIQHVDLLSYNMKTIKKEHWSFSSQS